MAITSTEDVGPVLCDSPRGLWQVLNGDDTAQPVIEASRSGDVSSLQTLLSQPRWSDTMFQKQRSIYGENLPSEGERQVLVRPLTNIERATTIAALNGHAAIVSTLLKFATRQGEQPASIIMREAISKAIQNGHTAVIDEMAIAWPGLITFNLHHGTLPLYDALRLRKPEVVAVLLKHGADPLDPAQNRGHKGYNVSLLSRAAMGDGPRMVEMLVKHNASIPGSGALGTAASCGQFDTVRFFLDHGADVNEALPPDSWTPMHLCAWKCRRDAMEFLKNLGAQSNAKDREGKTPADVLEQVEREKKLSWTR